MSNATAEQIEIVEGTQVVSIRQLPTASKYGSAWGVGLYEAKRRRDGALTWQMIEHLTGYIMGRNGAWRQAGCWSADKAWRQADQIANERGLRTLGVKHGQVIEAAPALPYELVEINDESGAQYMTPRATEHRTILGAKRASYLQNKARAFIRETETGDILWMGDASGWWRHEGQRDRLS